MELRKSFYSLVAATVLTVAAVPCRAQNSPEEKLNMAMYAVTSMYVDSLDKQALVDNEIASMLSKLDPFSQYLPPATATANEEALIGTSNIPQGVGICIEGVMVNGDEIFVTYVDNRCDAYTKGLRCGDRITAIDGTKVTELGDEAFAKLIGTMGTVVSLDIKKRNGGTAQYSVLRSVVPSSTVRTAFMLNKTTGYVVVTMFANNTVEDFRKTVSDLKKQGMKSLILDIRNNGGGLFDSATALADEFIDGERTLVSTCGAHTPNQTFKSSVAGILEKGRVVLLTNDKTMSAAEIFTAALRDWDRAVVVGKTTYGKGLIQETLPFSDGSAIRLTVARYVTPAGLSIQRPYETALSHTLNNGNSLEMINNNTSPLSLRTHRKLKVTNGGVAADIDVEPDTTHLNRWLGLITYSGVQKVTARRYIAYNLERLLKQYPTQEKFVNMFTVSNDLLDSLSYVSEGAGIPVNRKDLDKSAAYLKIQLKALIARDLYGNNNTYYKIMSLDDKTISKATEIINSKDEYDNILRSDAKVTTFTLKGEIGSHEYDGLPIYLTRYGVADRHLNTVVDSAVVRNGRYIFTMPAPANAYVASIALPPKDDHFLYGLPEATCIVEPGNVTVAYNGYDITLKGGTLNQQYDDMVISKERGIRRHITELGDKGQDSIAPLYKSIRPVAYKFIADNIKNDVGAYFFFAHASDYYTEDIYKDLLSKVNPMYIKRQQAWIEAEKEEQAKAESARIATRKGNPYTNFATKTIDGKTVHLADYIEKGKVTLVDFWASWCGPCIQETKTLRALYEQWHDKGFNIVGVSLDTDRKKWLSAIDIHKLQWTHLSSLDGWKSEAVKAYGIRAIPYVILIDREGNIALQNMHGEILENKIKELIMK